MFLHNSVRQFETDDDVRVRGLLPARRDSFGGGGIFPFLCVVCWLKGIAFPTTEDPAWKRICPQDILLNIH